MAHVKRDDVKQAWEETEFPLVCETCLGDNPYVRMTKEPYGKKCQVCESPFTVFAWQAGTKGRMKRVEICRACAQAKNVCQVCIYDLQYGLPVKVRDKVLREAAGSSAPNPATAVPQSTANRAWFSVQQQRLLEQSEGVAAQGNALAHAQLSEMAQMEPRYERNLPKLCSFYAKGECDRGSSCPFRHELPRDRNDPMNKQSTKNRFYGTSDPVANKILGRKRRQDEIQDSRAEDEGYDKARATLYLRFQGDAPYPNLTEGDVRDALYSFGEIVSVRVQAERGQAFVEYSQPEAAELAIASMNRKELLGRTVYTSWAKAPKRGEGGGDPHARGTEVATGGPSSSSVAPSGPRVVRPLAPPGADAHHHNNNTRPAVLPTVKLPPEVAAMSAARKNNVARGGGTATTSGGVGVPGVPRPSRVVGGLPRPGGSGAGPLLRGVAYPSADPNRLGTKASSSSPSS